MQMNNWKRQHPAAIFISFASNLKNVIVTLFAVFVLGQTMPAVGTVYYFALMGFILLSSLIGGFFKWWTFKYNLVASELNAKQGLIFRKNRYIRKERIQSIDINAKLLQRLFGLVELSIETAGGGNEPEFKIIALEREEARRIKQELLEKETRFLDEVLVESDYETEGLVRAAEKEIKPQRLVNPSYKWEIGGKRLFIAALTSSGVGIAATFLAVFVSQAFQFLPETLLEEYVYWFMQSSSIVLAVLVFFILFIAWLFTMLATVLKYGLFTIKKKGNDIHISRGVLEQRQLTLYAQRITAVRIVQSPIRQLFGFVSVYVESAGGGRQDEDLSTILVPMCKKNEVKSILEGIVPEYAIDPEYEGLPRESIRRYIFKLLFLAFIITGLLTYYIPYGYLSLILPVIAVILGFWQYRDTGIGQVDDLLCLRIRVFSKVEIIVPRKRIQSITTTQTILQSFDDLYTIHVSILSSITGKTFTVRHLANWQAVQSLEWYSYEKVENGNE